MSKTLFEKSKIESMNLKNRFFRSGTWENMADEKGNITKELEEVFINLAKGGVGTIITGYAFVCEEEQPNPGMLGAYSDDFIPQYKKLTSTIHELNTNIILQLAYGGSQSDFNIGSRTILGPSAVKQTDFGVIPKEMSKEDINYLISSFTKASIRAYKGGFDGVQIHCAHGYLLSQFLMPYYNKRTDEYGGVLENRARIIYEIIQSIKKELPNDFPIMVKINGTDNWENNGLTNEECIEVCKTLEKLGVSAIEVSGGWKADPIRKKLFKKEAQSYFLKEASNIANNVNIPVILVGGNRDINIMEDILETTKIKYFSLSRTLHSQADLVNMWEKGFRDRPRCVSCNMCWGEDCNICILDRKNK